MGNLCSKFGKNRSINYVTFLSTDAGRTDGRTDVYVILYSVQCICIALHWTDNNAINHAVLAVWGNWSVDHLNQSPKRLLGDQTLLPHDGHAQQFLVTRAAWISDQSVFSRHRLVWKLRNQLRQVWMIWVTFVNILYLCYVLKFYFWHCCSVMLLSGLFHSWICL